MFGRRIIQLALAAALVLAFTSPAAAGVPMSRQAGSHRCPEALSSGTRSQAGPSWSESPTVREEPSS